MATELTHSDTRCKCVFTVIASIAIETFDYVSVMTSPKKSRLPYSKYKYNLRWHLLMNVRCYSEWKLCSLAVFQHLADLFISSDEFQSLKGVRHCLCVRFIVSVRFCFGHNSHWNSQRILILLHAKAWRTQRYSIADFWKRISICKLVGV